MKFERTRVMNFEGALIGMRNPKNSWANSDSFFGLVNPEDTERDILIKNFVIIIMIIKN